MCAAFEIADGEILDLLSRHHRIDRWVPEPRGDGRSICVDLLGESAHRLCSFRVALCLLPLGNLNKTGTCGVDERGSDASHVCSGGVSRTDALPMKAARLPSARDVQRANASTTARGDGTGVDFTCVVDL